MWGKTMVGKTAAVSNGEAADPAAPLRASPTPSTPAPLHPGRTLQKLVGEKVKIPEIKRVFWAGDGTYIDFGSFWFELRASGTDAVLRFYIEGKDKEFLGRINQAFVGIADRKIKELRAAAET